MACLCSLQDAPYLLEPFAENFAGEDPTVRLALLTAACQLFFKRPPECQKVLGAVLAAGIADSNVDVHDRALLYYRWGGWVGWGQAVRAAGCGSHDS